MKAFKFNGKKIDEKISTSVLEGLQYIGLLASGVAAFHKPLLCGGVISLQLDTEPFTDKKDLIINQGALRNREISKAEKKLFKKKLMPSLVKSLPELDLSFSGKIRLHFGQGILQGVNLTTY